MKTSLLENTQDINAIYKSELQKNTMNLSISLLERKQTTYFRFIKLLLALFLMLSPLFSSAQTYNLISGAGGTTAGTIWNRTTAGTNSSGCNGNTINLGPAVGTGTGTYTLNFTGGTPVYSIAIVIDGMDLKPSGNADELEISINGDIATLDQSNFTCLGIACANNALFSSICSGQSIYQLEVLNNKIRSATISPIGSIAYAGRGVYRINSPNASTPITSISIKNYTNNSTGGTGIGCYLLSNVAGCTFAPTLSAITAESPCPVSTVNLNDLITSTPVGIATLVWFNNNTHTGAAVSNPTTVATSGTYYAFYLVAGCYSPASSPVVVIIDPICCAAKSQLPNLKN